MCLRRDWQMDGIMRTDRARGGPCKMVWEPCQGRMGECQSMALAMLLQAGRLPMRPI